MKTTGTATDYHDLLDKLRQWLTGTVGWTQLRWTAPASLTDSAELWVRGPGAGADRQVVLGFKSGNDVTVGAYGWQLGATPTFDGAQTWEAMPGRNPACYLNLWQFSTPYWFYANDRRVIVVAKCATSYVSYYGGFYLPFALPAEYPFPLAVIGNYQSLTTYDDSNTRNRMIADPGDGSGYYRTRASAEWRKFTNHYNRTADYYSAGSATAVIVWPHRSARATFVASATDWNQLAGFASWRPTAANEMPIIQCHIIDVAELNMPGALDGVFAAPGFNRAAEQLITVGGRTFRLFQNVFRSTARDFMAIEEI